MATSGSQMIEFTINPNDVDMRDYNMLLLIKGATKAAVHVDRRKERNKRECRNWKYNREE